MFFCCAWSNDVFLVYPLSLLSINQYFHTLCQRKYFLWNHWIIALFKLCKLHSLHGHNEVSKFLAWDVGWKHTWPLTQGLASAPWMLSLNMFERFSSHTLGNWIWMILWTTLDVSSYQPLWLRQCHSWQDHGKCWTLHHASQWKSSSARAWQAWTCQETEVFTTQLPLALLLLFSLRPSSCYLWSSLHGICVHQLRGAPEEQCWGCWWPEWWKAWNCLGYCWPQLANGFVVF